MPGEPGAGRGRSQRHCLRQGGPRPILSNGRLNHDRDRLIQDLGHCDGHVVLQPSRRLGHGLSGAFRHDFIMDHGHESRVWRLMLVRKEPSECPLQAIRTGTLHGAIQALGERCDI
jgi:hypothetical protein